MVIFPPGATNSVRSSSGEPLASYVGQETTFNNYNESTCPILLAGAESTPSILYPLP